MTEPIWKLYYRLGEAVPDAVTRTWPDGKQESCLVTDQAYLKWIEEGGVPLPAEET